VIKKGFPDKERKKSQKLERNSTISRESKPVTKAEIIKGLKGIVKEADRFLNS
jgi:hypothetical protein